jgi:predicted HicB family RNase H-like nuclease
MKQALNYKGYYTIPEFSIDDECFFGKILGIKSLILFEADNAKELVQAFHEAVDEYLADCKEEGIAPEKPFKGSLNVRLGEDLHLAVSLYAQEHDKKTNAIIKEAVEEYMIQTQKHKSRKSSRLCFA